MFFFFSVGKLKVEAEDADAGVNGQIIYSIDFGNQKDYFSIDGDTGAITLKKIIPAEAHQTAEFLLFITARDGNMKNIIFFPQKI